MSGLKQVCVMRIKKIIAAFALPTVAVVVAGGCGKSSAPPSALPIEQVPATMQKAFEGADAATKTAANEITTAVQNNDDVKAMLELQNLTGRSELTSEQREVAGRSIITVMERLQQAAAKGDKNAADALEMHRATK
jgi:hypothetical protein